MTITIGIPAYNEQRNIKKLIKTLLEQHGVAIDKIIVVNDGSTDRTSEEVTSIEDNKVVLFSINPRSGKNNALNQIFRNSKSDYLVTFDADVQINDTKLLAGVIDVTIKDKVDFASLKVIPINNTNIISKFVSFGQKMKNYYYETTKNTNNIHTCVGRGLIYSKNFYETISLPSEVIGDDAYIWLYAKNHGFNYKYLQDFAINYRSPSILFDHLNQNNRYRNSKQQLSSYFDEVQVLNEYKISFEDKLKSNFYGIRTNFLLYTGYLSIYLIAYFKSVINNANFTELWSPASSTK